MEKRILLSGTGGQGIIAAGEFLSEALFKVGYEVVNTRSYGAEARGGSSRSEVLVSDREIFDLELGEVDVLVVLSNQAYANFMARARKGALTLIEAEILSKLDRDTIRNDVEIVSIPGNEMAMKLGNLIVANMVFLGALAKLTGLLTLEKLEEAVKAVMRPTLQEVNILAVRAGYSIV